jgi:hypothetical protein
MTKAYAATFGRGRHDEVRDAALKRRIAALQKIVRAEHLDVSESAHAQASWALAESELGKMETFKAPRDKLVCALNTCRIINNTLTTRHGSDGGADDFLPVLVYVVLRANPDRLESNLKYIQRFRGESRLVSEAAYFFTNLVSAVRFLARAQAKDFTNLDEETFVRVMSEADALDSIDLDDDEQEEEAAKVAAEATRAAVMPASSSSLPPPRSTISVDEMSAALSALDEQHVNTPQSVVGGNNVMTPATPLPHTPLPHTPSGGDARASPDGRTSGMPYIPWRTTEDVEAEGATALTALDLSGNLVLEDYKFLYAKAEDLTVGDVSRLLHDYKGLALQYESLSRGTAKVLASLHGHAE